MKETSPMFSIIIPTRNRAVLLKRCIESVIDQSFQDWELIIIDDGSTDDTSLVVSSFDDKRILYFFQKHQERSSARNIGIDKAKGEYICFIDDDDYVLGYYLQNFYDYYQSIDFPEIILRTGFVRRDGSRQKPSINYDKRKHKNPVNFVTYNMCGVGSLSIPRSILSENKFPEEFPHWQDTHLFIRLLMKIDMVQLPSHNYIYNIHSEMGSQKAIRDNDILDRANINVAAIIDLFEKKKPTIYDFLPLRTLDFLKAEKYLEYANSALPEKKKQSKILFKKSLNSGFYFKFWKSYLINLKLRLL